MNRLDKALAGWAKGKKTEGHLGVFTFMTTALFDGQMAVAVRTNAFEKPVVALRKDCLGAKVDTYFDPDVHLRSTQHIVLEDRHFCDFMRSIMLLANHRTNPACLGIQRVMDIGRALYAIQSIGAINQLGELQRLPRLPDKRDHDLVVAGAKWKFKGVFDVLLVSDKELPLPGILGKLTRYYYPVKKYDTAIAMKLSHTGIDLVDIRDQSS